VVLPGDFPGLLDELLPADLAPSRAALLQRLLDDVLGRDASVVGARHPEGLVAEHPVVAHLDIL
jgi:hypothetical protein